MIIRVIFKDEKYDMVNASQLDTLILTGKIKKFLRSTGWVDIQRIRYACHPVASRPGKTEKVEYVRQDPAHGVTGEFLWTRS